MKETELMNEDSLKGILSSLGDRTHNINCKYQDEELLEVTTELWKLSDQASNETESEKSNVKSITIVTDKFFFTIALASLLLNLYLMV